MGHGFGCFQQTSHTGPTALTPNAPSPQGKKKKFFKISGENARGNGLRLATRTREKKIQQVLKIHRSKSIELCI
jgi:hypothetical protein